MPKRSLRGNKGWDFAVTAFRVVEEAIGEQMSGEALEIVPDERNQTAVELGRIGGLKGGKARSEKLTPEQRKRIAKKAAAARWKKR